MKTAETTHTPGSLDDQQAGYPAYRAQLAVMSDRALSAEYSWILRGTCDRIFGRMPAPYPLVVGEMARRGLSR